MFSNHHPRRRATLLAVTAAVAVGQLALSSPASASAKPAPTPAPSLSAPEAATLPAGTRFYTPQPDPGAKQQIAELKSQHRFADAALVSAEVETPQAVWFTSGTPEEVRKEVQRTVTQARAHKTVPTLVAYNVPGRDCSQYSAGGAADDAAYRAWADGFAAGLTKAGTVTVILEPDGLPLMPSDCPAGTYPVGSAPTDAGRLADINYIGQAIERADPAALVYLDAGHNGWHNVASIADRLQDAGVEQFQGFSLNTSNYQYTADLTQYGTWISQCLAILPDDYTHTPLVEGSDPCPNQYWNGGPSNGYQGVALDPMKQWSDTATDPTANTRGINERFATLLGDTVPTEHFVIDTSRNGQGPWAPAQGVTYPDPQTWCNPPARGLGARPQAQPNADFPLLDAYLWVKTPGQSDGECNRGIAGSTSDPEWGGITDPAAGAWFPQQALELAELAVPALR